MHTLLGVIIAALLFPFASKNIKLLLIQWWNKRLLSILNVKLRVQGHLPPPYQKAGNIMFVANHISWLEIIAINSIIPTRFIAKSDIQRWPVFGYLARKANVLFISREKRHDAVRMLSVASHCLQAGDTLCLFAEGTTTDGTHLKPFKSSLMQAAIDANALVWPIAIGYANHDGSVNTQIAYAGDTTLMQSIARILSQKQIALELRFLAPIATASLWENEKERRKLTLHIEKLIKQQLKLN